MNKINLNLEHCFGIAKLSQELTFEGGECGAYLFPQRFNEDLFR